MQEFLEYAIKGLVSHPDQVSITSVDKGGMTVFQVRLHADDMGKVIGRQGITISALRSLLTAGSAKKGLRCNLEVVDEGGPRSRSVDAAD